MRKKSSSQYSSLTGWAARRVQAVRSPQGTSKSVVIDRMRARPDGAPSKRSRVLWLAALAEETLSSSRDVIRHMIGREYVSLVLFLAAAWRGKKLVEVRPFPGVDR